MDVLGIQQYAINSLLFLRIIQDKYISLYRELITQLCTYVSAIRILAKGYLPNTLLTPKRLQGILSEITAYHKSRLYFSSRQVTFIL